MFCYRAYGLGIHCDLDLPGFPTTECPADVVIRRERIEVESLPEDPYPVVEATARQAIISARDVGKLVIRDGCEVTLALRADVDLDYVRNIVHGPILEAILHQRGFVVLHASSVAKNGAGIVFMAESGSGKSTLAAAMNARGWGVLADDVTAIEIRPEGAPLLYPGLPHVNLWPESVESLGLTPDSLVPVHPKGRKAIWRTLAGHMADPAGLRCVCVLTTEEPAGISLLPPQAAFASVLRNVPLTISRLISGTGREALSFPQYARLAGTVPIHLVRQPHTAESLASIGQLAQRIEELALGHDA